MLVGAVRGAWNGSCKVCSSAYSSVCNRTEAVAQAVIYAVSWVSTSLANKCHLLWAYGGRLVAQIRLAFAHENIDALKAELTTIKAAKEAAEKEAAANREKAEKLEIANARTQQDYATVCAQLCMTMVLCSLIWQAQNAETGVTTLASGALEAERARRVEAESMLVKYGELLQLVVISKHGRQQNGASSAAEELLKELES